MNFKIIGPLLSLALLSTIFYVSVLLHTEPLHEFGTTSSVVIR